MNVKYAQCPKKNISMAVIQSLGMLSILVVGCEPRSDISGLTDAESMWQPSLAMEINGKGGAKSAVSALPKTVRKLNLAWGC